MFISDDVTCKICSKIFCCKNCRRKHEEKHKEIILNSCESDSKKPKTPYFNLCPICNQRPYLLDLEEPNENLISHMAEYHLPMHCLKCTRIFDNVSDLINHAKCLKNSNTNNRDTVKFNDIEDNMISQKIECSTQTSPFLEETKNDTNEIDLLFDSKFKLKNRFSRHSISTENISIKNVSSINCSSIRFKTNSNGKLVRTTSTPLQELFARKQQGVFDSLSNEHVSSIYNSHSESDISPPIKPMILSPRSEKNERFGKHQMARIRSNKKVETPLRHVMSKSIRKAISKHGPLILNGDSNKCLSQKILFRNEGSPLDLRTTPVLRRVHSEVSEKSTTYEAFGVAKSSTRRFSISSKTESIFIKSQSANLDSKLDTIYTTCRSIEVITTELTEESHENTKKKNSNNFNSASATPKCVGAPKLKKAINFKTPITPAIEDDDVFYTPKSCTNKFKNKKKMNEDAEEPQEDKSAPIENDLKENSSSGKIWSFINSFVRIPSFSFKSDNDNDLENQNHTSSLIKRCSSLKDYLTKSISPPEQNLKRKRTASSDITLRSNHINSYFEMETDELKGPKRIRGRKPIERMRNNS